MRHCIKTFLKVRERDILHREKVETLQSSLKKCERQNEELQYKISKQNNRARSQSEKFEKARVELENVAHMLDLREREVEQKIADKEDKCYRLTRTIHQLEEELASTMEKMGQLATCTERLNSVIENEMVSIEDYSTLKGKYEKLQNAIASDMVDIEEYNNVLRKLDNLKVTISTDMIPRDEYELLQDKYIRLQSRSEDTVPKTSMQELQERYDAFVDHANRMVPREKYDSLKAHYHQSLLDLKLLEQSSLIFRDDCATAKQHIQTSEARAEGLVERVESSEREIRELMGTMQQAQQRERELQEELEEARSLAADREQSVRRLEGEKAALLVQLGNTKTQLSREMHLRNETVSALAERERTLVELKEEKSKTVAGSAKMIISLQEAHAKQCKELQENCFQWKRIVDDLQRELCFHDTEGAEIPVVEATQTAPSHTADSFLLLSNIDNEPRKSIQQAVSRPGYSRFKAQREVPVDGEASTLSTLVARLDQQERELTAFRQHLSLSVPVGVYGGSRETGDRNSVHTEASKKQTHMTSSDRAHISDSRGSVASALSPMSARELLDSPLEKEYLLRSLQREFDSHLLSSSKYVNDKLSQQPE